MSTSTATVHSPRRRTAALGLVAAVLAVTALAGCSDDDGSGDAGPAETVTVTETPSSSSSAPPATSSTPPADDDTEGSEGSEGSGGSGGSGGSATPLCGTPDLGVTVRPTPGGGGAGSTRQTVSFSNDSDHACTLDGYAGVSYVADGEQVGAAAVRIDQDQRSEVRLAPGDSASEIVTVASPGAQPECDPTPVDGFRIYPPHNRQSVVVASAGTGCAATGAAILQVSPVVAA